MPAPAAFIFGSEKAWFGRVLERPDLQWDQDPNERLRQFLEFKCVACLLYEWNRSWETDGLQAL